MNDKPADPLQLSYARPRRRWTAQRIGILCGAGLPVLVNALLLLLQHTAIGKSTAFTVVAVAVNLPGLPCVCSSLMDEQALGFDLLGSTVVSSVVWAFVGRFIGWLCEGTPWEQERRHPGEVESGRQD